MKLNSEIKNVAINKMDSLLKKDKTKEAETGGCNELSISLREYIDGRKLRHIINNVGQFNLSEIIHKQGVDMDGQLTILKKYLKKISGGSVKVDYKQNNKLGRYFAKNALSLQNISRPIRHTIAKDFYQDIDMKNAHPVILAHYLQAHDIKHPHLNDYINNRDTFFKVMSEPDGMNLNREDAKKKILAIMNGGRMTADDHDKCPNNIRDFYNEMLSNRMLVMELEPDLVASTKRKRTDRKKSDWNLDGAVMNMVLCDYENRILMTMSEFFTTRGFEIGVLVFDGIMIKKTDGKPIDNDLLSECSAYIFQQHQIKIELAIKEMDEGFNLDNIEFNDYPSLKTKFEENMFKCISESLFYNTEDNKCRSLSRTDVQTSYEHLVFITDDGSEKSFIKMWLKDPDMRVYNYVECLPPPLVELPQTYNLWRGFDVALWDSDKEQAPALDFILNHIKMLCNWDDDCYDYFIKWLACMFQKPAFKNNVAVLFKTKQGMGKDMFYSLLEKMMGTTYCGNTARVERDIFGDFNGFLKNKILVVLNEFSGAVGFKYSDKLKDLITSTKDKINDKNVKLKDSPSYCHYLFFTNNDFPIKIEADERRTFVVENLQKVPPKEYFDKFIDIIENNEGGVKLFYNHLMAIDISKTDWKNDRPITEFMRDLLIISQDRELSFLIDLITKPTDSNIVVKDMSSLIDDFRVYTQNYEYKTNAQKFGIKIKKYQIDGMTKVRDRNKGSVYEFNINQSIRSLIENKLLPDDFIIDGIKPKKLMVVDYDDDNPNLPPL